MKIKFCGAAREVTGSCHYIELEDGFSFILDCGLYQGYDEEMEKTNAEWMFDPGELDCVILSHAHIDHSGKLPRLFRDGFDGMVHATHATRSLCSIMLLDSAYIHERDAEYLNKKRKKRGEKPIKPLYTAADVEACMENFTTYGYDHWVKINDRVELNFRDAGHILGSASVNLRIKENGRTVRLGFTGDIGRPERPILRDPKPMYQADYLICESTYGNRLHPAKPEEMERFLKIIRHTCLEKKGRLFIPAFSVGRTQELVYMLDQIESEGRLPRIPVYVDSPLAINATEIYGAHPECYDNFLNEYLLTDDNPFGFRNLHYVRDVEISKRLNTDREPCIIISASGMMTAGRIVHHLYHNVSRPENTFLIVGYCSPGTSCGTLKTGAREVRVFGDMLPVKADIEIMDSFSAHGDRDEMLAFIAPQLGELEKLYLVHGEYDTQVEFSHFLEGKGFSDIEIPYRGQEVVLS